MNCFKSFAKLKKALIKLPLGLALSLAAVATSSAFAIDGTATVTGGEVQFYGAAETNWLNGTELLL